MSVKVVAFEFKNSLIQRFMQQCSASLELSFFTQLATNNISNMYKKAITDSLVSAVISEAIFLAMFYEVLNKIYEGQTIIDTDDIYAVISPQSYLDKQIFQEKYIIDDVTSYESVKFFDDLNELIYTRLARIVPVNFVIELIDCVLDNKPTIDYLQQSGYYVTNSLSRCVISYRSFTGVDAVYTQWAQYNYVYKTL
jgi:hypothetical protein